MHYYLTWTCVSRYVYDYVTPNRHRGQWCYVLFLWPWRQSADEWEYSKMAASFKISYSVLYRLVKNNYQETNHNWKDTLSKRRERLFFTRKYCGAVWWYCIDRKPNKRRSPHGIDRGNSRLADNSLAGALEWEFLGGAAQNVLSSRRCGIHAARLSVCQLWPQCIWIRRPPTGSEHNSEVPPLLRVLRSKTIN